MGSVPERLSPSSGSILVEGGTGGKPGRNPIEGATPPQKADDPKKPVGAGICMEPPAEARPGGCLVGPMLCRKEPSGNPGEPKP